MNTTHALPDLNTLDPPDLYQHLARTGLPRRLFQLARDEDTQPFDEHAAPGDITTAATQTSNTRATARLTLRQHATIAGLAAMPDLLHAYDATDTITITPHTDDAQTLDAGTTLATLTGPVHTLLVVERPILNTISHLSGIATLTKRYNDALDNARPHNASLFDTRKNTPGLRALEKYAVRCGGASLHRLNLTDAVLIKDNHIAHTHPDRLADAAATAARAARDDRHLRFVEVEVDTLDQLDALLTLTPGTIDVVLLDNMGTDQLADAAKRRDAHNPALILEASGGVSLDTIPDIARTGVDRIAVGAITHQATSVDIGLDIPA